MKVLLLFMRYSFGLKLASDVPDDLLKNVLGEADRLVIGVEHKAPILIDKLKTVDHTRGSVSLQYMHMQVAGLCSANWHS